MLAPSLARRSLCLCVHLETGERQQLQKARKWREELGRERKDKRAPMCVDVQDACE